MCMYQTRLDLLKQASIQVDCRGSTSSKEITCRKNKGWEGLDDLTCKKTTVSILGTASHATDNYHHISVLLLAVVTLHFI